MSMTVYVEGWHEQPYRESKVYLSDLYPGLDEEDFAGSPVDEEGRHYQVERVSLDPFPSLSVSDCNWSDLADLLGLADRDGLTVVDIPAVIRRCIRVLNSPRIISRISRPMVANGNFINCASTDVAVKRRVGTLLEVLKFAQAKGRGVYWA